MSLKLQKPSHALFVTAWRGGVAIDPRLTGMSLNARPFHKNTDDMNILLLCAMHVDLNHYKSQGGGGGDTMCHPTINLFATLTVFSRFLQNCATFPKILLGMV